MDLELSVILHQAIMHFALFSTPVFHIVCFALRRFLVPKNKSNLKNQIHMQTHQHTHGLSTILTPLVLSGSRAHQVRSV